MHPKLIFQDCISVILWHVLPIIAMWIVTGASQGKLSQMTKSEKLNFYWFLVNGALVYLLYDGFCGLLSACGPITRIYHSADARFIEKDTFFNVILQVQLFVLCPLCLYVSRKYFFQRDIARKRKFTIIVTVLQIATHAAFVLQEAFYYGYANTHQYHGLSIYNIVYFWIFFILVQAIYLVVPTIILLNTLQQKQFKKPINIKKNK